MMGRGLEVTGNYSAAAVAVCAHIGVRPHWSTPTLEYAHIGVRPHWSTPTLENIRNMPNPEIALLLMFSDGNLHNSTLLNSFDAV